MSQREKEKERLRQSFEQLYDELWVWREQHPEASFDDIAAQVTPRRRALIAQLLGALACQHGTGQVPEGQKCQQCGQAMEYKGEPSRVIAHYLEGETDLGRAYYHCPHCKAGLFPPG